MAVGSMIASLIGTTTPLVFADGTLVLQTVLDSVMPKMIPLILTGCMYALIKRGIKTEWLLVVAIAGGIVLSALGILA